MQRKGAAESFKGPSRVAADGQGQLVFRQVLLGGQMQIGIDHVWLSPFRPFVAAEELYAGRVRRTGSEAQRGAAAFFAVFHLDAAPAIATGHEVIGEAAVSAGTRTLRIGHNLGPAT